MKEKKFKIIFELYHAELFDSIKAMMGSYKKSELIAVYCFIALMLHDSDDPIKFLFDQAKYECKRYIDPEETEAWYVQKIMLDFNVITIIVNAIQALPIEEVNIAVAIRYDGLTQEQAAKRFCITVDSVRVRYSNAKSKFYSSFSQQTNLL